jgi:hypothetical protein
MKTMGLQTSLIYMRCKWDDTADASWVSFGRSAGLSISVSIKLSGQYLPRRGMHYGELCVAEEVRGTSYTVQHSACFQFIRRTVFGEARTSIQVHKLNWHEHTCELNYVVFKA